MTLPSSGTLTFSMIRDEFGGSNPVVFSDYYRGGGLVPDISPNINIPTSGTIKLSDFYGATSVAITLTAYDAAGGNSSGSGSAYAGVAAKRDGNIAVDSGSYPGGAGPAGDYTSTNDVGGDPNEWADPPDTAVGDNYHVRMVTSSGSLTTGTADTWLALTQDRIFEVARGTVGSSTWTGKMQISEDGGSTVLEESAEFTLEANIFG